jgi:8-oxo-dGTP pyrophosphatase MutT (NUDIX family)
MNAFASPGGLRIALHPLGSPPPDEPYNRDELRGLLSDDLVPMLAAVLVGIVVRGDIPRVLLTLRTDGLRHHAGQVSFPGGRMEAGDDGPLGTAQREAREEIGLPPTSFEPLGYLDPMLTITGFRVTPVVGRIDPAFQPHPDPNEVAEVFEVPLAYLVAPDTMQAIDLHVGGRPRRVLEYVGPGAGGRRIWGATALILHNLAQRLEHTRLEQA